MFVTVTYDVLLTESAIVLISNLKCRIFILLFQAKICITPYAREYSDGVLRGGGVLRGVLRGRLQSFTVNANFECVQFASHKSIVRVTGESDLPVMRRLHYICTFTLCIKYA